jgi:hypothetical protein
MPWEKAQDLPFCFLRRHPNQANEFAWAHFDLTEFADIVNQFWNGNINAL